MKKLFLFLTLLFVGISANAQFTPSNNLNYVKLLKVPPAGAVEDSVLVYDGSDLFVKMRPASSMPVSTSTQTALDLKENTANKQDSLVTDGTGVKYPTIDAISGGTVYKRTIAQIRALTGILPNISFYTTNINQEGFWYYDATDTTSADNTGTVLVTADGKRIKRVVNGNIYPEWFGAIGDAVTDDASAINSAISVATNKNLVFTKRYLIKSKLVLKSNTSYIGVKGSEIIINNTFVKGATSPSNEFAIYNEKFSTTYSNPDTSIIIKGIKFTQTITLPSINYTILGFANINNLTISECESYINGSIFGNNLDLYACYNNVNITNNTFENTTNTTIGGCIWLRNRAANGALASNDCYAVNIIGNNFRKKCNDEVVAIWGSLGKLSNVNVISNSFKFDDYSVSVGLSVFGDETNSSALAITENVNISNNTFIADNFLNSLIQVGVSTDVISTVKNVNISGNVIRAKVTSTGTSTVFKATLNANSENVNLLGNNIYNNGSVNINYGFSGFTIVQSNNISGKFNYGGAISGKVSGNIITNPLGRGFLNCKDIINNTIYCGDTGIDVTANGNYNVKNNVIENTSTACYGLDINTASPVVYVEGNRFNITTGRCISNTSTGSITATNNNNQNTATFVYGNLIYSSGNKISSSGFDNLISGRISNFDTEDALPIGHISIDTSLPSDYTGWQKIATGHGIDKWRKTGINPEVGLSIGSSARSSIFNGTTFFSNVLPVCSFSPITATNGTYENVIVFKAPNNDATAVLRRLGMMFKLSNESNNTESLKSGGLIVESTNAFSNSPSLSLVLGALKVVSFDFSGNAVFSTKATTPALNVSGQTASRIALFDASRNIISADTATYPSLAELVNLKGVTSPIKNVVSSSVSTTGTATTVFTVTIGSTRPNNTYKVTATPSNVLSCALFYINNKTTTTFDVVYLAGLTGAVAFDWILTD